MKRYNKFIFWMFLLAGNICAFEIEIWREGNIFYPMIREEKTKFLISNGCDGIEKNCEAFKVVNIKQENTLSENIRRGGKNPGAIICKKKFKGVVMILVNSEKNESAFCKFKDNSLVSVNALSN